MSDDTFRIVVTVAVALACISFLAQSFVVLGLYRAIRRMQGKVEPLIERAEPLVAKVGPVVDSAKPLIEKASATVEKAGPILDNVRRIVEETRPRITEVSSETVAIAKATRQHVDRIGALIDDAGERARTRLAQIDESVESTVEQVENVGGAVKRAVLKPVREVNGIAAGVSAAVAAIVQGSRRSSVDAATADEELFI